MVLRWESGREPSILVFQGPLWRAVAKMARPYRGRMVLLGLLITGGTLLPLVQPLLYRTAIDYLVARRPIEEIALLAVAAGVVAVTGILLTYAYTVSAGALGRHIIADLQLQLYDRLAAMPLEFFTTLKGGAAGARVTTDVYATEPMFTRVLVALVANVLTVLAAIVILFTVDPRLTLLLAVVPFIFWPVRKTEERINSLIRAQNGLNTQLVTTVEAVLSSPGMTLARQSGQLPRETARFHRGVEDLRRRATTLVELYTRINSGFNLLFGVVTSVVFLVGAWMTSTGELSLGTLVLFLLYIRQIQAPIATLGGLRYEMLRAARAFDRVFEVLNADVPGDVRSSNGVSRHTEGALTPALDGVEATSPPISRGLATDEEAQVVDRDGGAAQQPVLVFEDVHFRYRRFTDLAIGSLSEPLPSTDSTPEAAPNGRVMPWVLDGVSLSVSRGELVAVVGASGAGKSTIALLAAGLYQPTDGSVRVEGRTTATWTDAELAQRVALITQDTYVLHDTVRGNLRYVNEDATDDELAAACAAAHLGALIASLPDGYDTLVGERGYRLSGGERQRLAVARALLKDADLIIQDEPTSQLDAETELLIKQTTEKLFASKAVLTIAHRLSTIVDANRILVLSGGVIVEEGTHDVLMGLTGGRYAALYRAQVRGVG